MNLRALAAADPDTPERQRNCGAVPVGDRVEIRMKDGSAYETWARLRHLGSPIARIEAAHAIEKAAHALAKDLIVLARQAGRSWHEIGDGLDLHWAAVAAKEPIAEVPTTMPCSTRPGRQCARAPGPAQHADS